MSGFADKGAYTESFLTLNGQRKGEYVMLNAKEENSSTEIFKKWHFNAWAAFKFDLGK